jgi:hypothetical protein
MQAEAAAPESTTLEVPLPLAEMLPAAVLALSA